MLDLPATLRQHYIDVVLQSICVNMKPNMYIIEVVCHLSEDFTGHEWEEGEEEDIHYTSIQPAKAYEDESVMVSGPRLTRGHKQTSGKRHVVTIAGYIAHAPAKTFFL